MTNQASSIVRFALARPGVEGLEAPAAASVIESFIASLEEADSVQTRIYLDGFLLDLLQEKQPAIPKRLGELSAEGKIQILCGLYFEPLLSLCSDSEIAELVAISCERWQSLGVESFAAAWLPYDGWHEGVARALFEVGVREFIFHTSSLPSGNALFQGEEISLRSNSERDANATLDHLDLSQLPEPSNRAVLDKNDSSALLLVRSNDIERHLQTLPSYIEEHGLVFANRERYKIARKWFLQSKHRPILDSAPLPHADQQALRKDLYRALLHAQVDIDSIYHPEIDPNDGWAKHELIDYDNDGEEEHIVDTPFMRCYFKGSRAGLLELDYKPRKLNLLDCSCGGILNPQFSGRLIEEKDRNLALKPLERSATLSAPRKNGGLVIQRAVESLTLPGKNTNTELYKDFSIRAGLGSYRPNSTTGFTLEYWFEETETFSEELFLLMEWSMKMPSSTPELLSARRLIAAGGIDDNAFPLSEPLQLDQANAASGIYGIRLIDGLDHFVIDIRSSKQLHSLTANPHYEGDDKEKIYAGTRVTACIKAETVRGDDHSASLFLSIA